MSHLDGKQNSVVKIKCSNSGKEYSAPANINVDTLSFLSAAALSGTQSNNVSATQAVFDALVDPEFITGKLLVSAMIGAQNRSNELYEQALNSSDIRVKSVYFKYASKFADRVAPLAEALSRQKHKSQKIVVERINIERGAQAVVGNVNHGS